MRRRGGIADHTCSVINVHFNPCLRVELKRAPLCSIDSDPDEEILTKNSEIYRIQKPEPGNFLYCEKADFYLLWNLHINEKIPRMPRSWNLVQFVLKMNCKAKLTSSIGKFLRSFSRKFDAHMIKMWRVEYSALCYRKLAFMRKHGLNMYSTEKFKSV